MIKVSFKTNNFLNSTMMASFLLVTVSKKNKQTEKNVSFIAVYHKFTSILKKLEKNHDNDCLNLPTKTSPRHLNFLNQLKKTTEMMPLLRVLFLDTPGHPRSAPQYRNSSKYTIYAHNNQKFWHSLSPRGGQGRT